MQDISDLAEMLFPNNRNQQHAFLVVWISLKWADQHIVPNLHIQAEKHAVSRRTLQRVRAKMRRMGLIDHVSRFNSRYGYREGWVLSSRLEKSLILLADRIKSLKSTEKVSKDKDIMLVSLADARR
jgi:hypothetical protein